MSYDVTAKTTEVFERLRYVIANLTPELAPALAFREHTDNTCALHNVTEPERMRLFEIKMGRPFVGETARGSKKAAYTVEVRIKVGYSLQPFEEIDGVSYRVEDLKEHDFEQLDQILVAGAPFAAQGSLPEVEDAHLAVLDEVEGQRDIFRGRVRQTLYRLELFRTHTG